MHVVLLGDSIFDNLAYVGGGPDVIFQLQARLPSAAKATLMAVDGSVITDVADQLSELPPDASHVFVSVGGNDALGYASVLAHPCRSVGEALCVIADVRDEFRQRYREMLNLLAATGLPTTVCTIYEPRYEDPMERRASATALCVLNDSIVREARERDITVLELRAICDEDGDFANPIEPSTQGGDKIASAIAEQLGSEDRDLNAALRRCLRR